MRKFGLTAGLILLFLLLMMPLRISDPPPHPDEAYFVDVALTYNTTGLFGSDLWEYIFPHADTHTSWYSALPLILLAQWIKLTGIDISLLRVPSLFTGLATLLVFILILRRLPGVKESWIIPVLSIILILEPLFGFSARIIRSEIFVLFFGLISIYTYLRYLQDQHHKGRMIILTGICVAFAVLFHSLGVFFGLTIAAHMMLREKTKIFTNKFTYFFIGAAGIPIFIWVLSMIPHIDIIREQLSIVAARKRIELPQFLLILIQGTVLQKLIYLSQLILSFSIVAVIRARKVQEYTLIALLSLFSWIFSSYGQMGAYMVYPFVINIIILGLGFVNTTKRLQQFYIVLVTLLLIAHAFTYLVTLSEAGFQAGTYKRYSSEILSLIPDNTTVFLSAIPDPYFAFKSEKRSNKLYQYAYMHTSYKNYFQKLNNSDYMVYSKPYDGIIFGPIQEYYIASNQKSVSQLEIMGEPVFVIELVPRVDRVIPPEFQEILQAE